MIPILFAADATVFDTQGLGALSDAVSCTVTEERNGVYELEMTYPMTGVHFADIADRTIIYAIPSPYRQPQPFRVYRITRPINGIVTVYAQHLRYDQSGIPVSPYKASSIQLALQGLKQHAAVDNPFAYTSDIVSDTDFEVAIPMAALSLLGGVEGSMLDVYGGEYEFDGYNVRLWSRRGRDNGVTIAYGKNLRDVVQDRNIADVATGIYPYWTNGEGTLVEAPGKIVRAPGAYGFERIVTVDLTSHFEAAPTPEQLAAEAAKYITANKIGVPSVSITASFVQLEQTADYQDMSLIERCDLCDTVHILFEAIGVNATAQIVKITTDVLSARYLSVEIGDARTNIADTVAAQQGTLNGIASPGGALYAAVNNATKWITNGRGHMVAVKDAAGNWTELVSLDTDDIETAKNVWRWNNGGFGHSANGYNGPYTTAITQDGHIVADFITAGSLNAAVIKTGLLQSNNGKSTFDLDSGLVSLRGLIENIGINATNQKEIKAFLDNSGLGITVESGYTRGIYLYNRNGDAEEHSVAVAADNISVTRKSGSPPEGMANTGTPTIQLYLSTDGFDYPCLIMKDKNNQRVGWWGDTTDGKPILELANPSNGGKIQLYFDGSNNPYIYLSNGSQSRTIGLT